MSWLTVATKLIQRWEGCKLTAYPDPASGGDPWTIGFGATGPGIRQGLTWSQVQADADLQMRLIRTYGPGVDAAVNHALTDNQKGALVSLAYNIGLGNFASSTLVKKLNARDPSAPAQFDVWNKAAGRVMAGLTNRRAAERAVFEASH